MHIVGDERRPDAAEIAVGATGDEQGERDRGVGAELP
jgi:hypothetical protein